MQHTAPLSATPAAYLAKHSPDAPVLFIAPSVLQATARRFQADFDGLVTYAVKANDRPEVLSNLVAAGITTFDVASPAEMAAVRAVCPQAVLHYNNPVRSAAEVQAGIAADVYSWSIDDMSELAVSQKSSRPLCLPGSPQPTGNTPNISPTAGPDNSHEMYPTNSQSAAVRNAWSLN